jgi:hypothetical protein
VVFGRSARLLHNERGRGFRSLPLVAGEQKGRTFAATIGDFDGDGRPDLVTVNKGRRLLRNAYAGTNGHLRVELKAEPGAAVGARVRAYYSDGTVTAQRYGSARSSAFSQALQPLHFGRPAGLALEAIGVQWPGTSIESRISVDPGATSLTLERPGSR